MDIKMHKAITILQLKLEGQLIMRRPQFEMEDRLLLDKIDYEKKTIMCYGQEYPIKDIDFPTVDPENPYELTEDEATELMRIAKNYLYEYQN